MKGRPKPPCDPKCPKRKVGCRSTCEGWQKYQVEYEEYQVDRAKEAGYKAEVISQELKRAERIRKRRRR